MQVVKEKVCVAAILVSTVVLTAATLHSKKYMKTKIILGNTVCIQRYY